MPHDQRQINFNALFFKALQSGKKTKTRRPMMFQPVLGKRVKYSDSRYGRPGDLLRATFTNVDFFPLILEITKIRIERIKNISEEDLIAEGIVKTKQGYWFPNFTKKKYKTPIAAFKQFWTSIYDRKIWDLNEYVWVVDFRKVKVNVEK